MVILWSTKFPESLYFSVHWCVVSILGGFPGGSDGKASACNAGDLGSIPEWGKSPGEGNGNPLQHSCLENPMDSGAWWAAVHGVVKSRTRLSDFPFTFHFDALEKEMVTHSSVLAWRIPGTGEPGGLLSMGSRRVRYNWSDLAAAAPPQQSPLLCCALGWLPGHGAYAGAHDLMTGRDDLI